MSGINKGRRGKPAEWRGSGQAPAPRKRFRRLRGEQPIPITILMLPVFLAGVLFASVLIAVLNPFHQSASSTNPIAATAIPTASPSATPAPLMMPTPATSQAGVAARVGDQVIPMDLFVTLTQVEALSLQRGSTNQTTGQKVAPVNLATAAGLKVFHAAEQRELNGLIHSAVATIYARQHHLLATAKEIQARQTTLSSTYGSIAAFYSAVEAQGYTKSAVDQIIANQVTENNVFKIIGKQAPIDGRHVRHILFAAKDKALALQVARTLQANHGATFVALAKKYSKDKTMAAAGGDLGVLARGETVAPFDKAIFSMKTGQISDPVKTQFGWHVIQVLGPGQSAAGMTAYFTKWVDKLRAKTPVHIYVTIPK